MTGTPQGSTESGFMEKPGIELATPGLQGIALIHYSTGAPYVDGLGQCLQMIGAQPMVYIRYYCAAFLKLIQLWHVRRCNIVCGNICVVYRNNYVLKHIFVD